MNAAGAQNKHLVAERRRTLDWIVADGDASASDSQEPVVRDVVRRLFGDVVDHRYPMVGDPTAERRVRSAAVFDAYFTGGASLAGLKAPDIDALVAALVAEGDATDAFVAARLRTALDGPDRRGLDVLEHDLLCRIIDVDDDGLQRMTDRVHRVRSSLTFDGWLMLWGILLGTLRDRDEPGERESGHTVAQQLVLHAIAESPDPAEAHSLMSRGAELLTGNAESAPSWMKEAWHTRWTEYRDSADPSFRDLATSNFVEMLEDAVAIEQESVEGASPTTTALRAWLARDPSFVIALLDHLSSGRRLCDHGRLGHLVLERFVELVGGENHARDILIGARTVDDANGYVRDGIDLLREE